jgi:hypothetical protein
MRAIRTRAWWVFVPFGVMFGLFGVTDLLAGVLSDPGITVAISGMSPAEVQAVDPVGYRLFDFATRTLGLSLIVIGLLVTTIALIPYRAGQRWAWAVMWWLPAWGVCVPLFYLAFGVAPGAPPAPPMVSGPIIAALAAATLLADRRRFAVDGAARMSPGFEPA